MNGVERVGIPWAVSTGFVRLTTNPSAMSPRLSPMEAIDHVEDWFRYAHVTPIYAGSNHLTYFRRNLRATGVGGNRVPDAHIAALAMEYDAEVDSNDSDFGRFPGLRWRNPLQSWE